MRLNLLKTVPVGTIALVLSIGLHGLLLGLPLPERDVVSEQTEPEASESLEPIAIRAAVLPVAAPKPTISPTPQSAPKATPKPAPQAVAPQFPAGVIVRPVPQAAPVPAIVPSPSPVPSPAATPIVVSPSPTPSPTPSPELSPSPTPSPDAFTANFPHFENAQAGCFGLETCRQIEGEVSFREVGRTMMAQLEAKGYTVRLRDDLADDTGRKVYEVSKDDETQYLSVLSGLDLGRTVYVLAAEPMTIEDLQTGNVGGVPEG